MYDQILNLLYSGIVYGSVLSLISLGYSLLYGVGKILNLSHGFFYVLTGYLAFWVLPIFNYNIWITIPVSLIMITVIAGVVYLALIKPLQRSELNVVLITFALAFFMEQFIRAVWGSEYLTIYQLIIFPGTTEFLGISIINQSILLVIVSLVLIAAFTLFISKSKLGRSIRAVAQDRDAAQLMGINADRILMYTVMISGFLAGVGALLYLPNYTLDPVQGWTRLTDAFAVVILGGMGSLIGSFIGAYIIAFANNFTSIFFPPYGASWSHVVPIILILIMLIARPRGLFGKKELM